MLRSTSLALLLLIAACGSPSPAIDGGADASTGLDAAGFDAGKLDGGYVTAAPSRCYVDAGYPRRRTARHRGAVHYPAGTRTVSMRGSADPFNLDTRAAR